MNLGMLFLYKAIVKCNATVTFLPPQIIQVTEYYANGEYQSVFHIKHGMLDGLDICYGREGQVVVENHYTNGVLTQCVAE